MTLLLFSWMKKVVPVLLGAAAGYAYYYYIGCVGGGCPITGNPWSSTMYGAAVGALIVPWRKQQPNETEPDSTGKSGQ